MKETAPFPGSDRPITTHVELRQLTVQAGRQVLLRNTTVRFDAGKVTLIVGRSGVGKSTLLKVIAGLIDEREEGLRVAGDVVMSGTSGPLPNNNRSFGVVFQDFALFDELSPLDNIRLAYAHRSKQSRNDPQRVPEQLLDELGIPADVPTASLSGGQRQRLAIARVLAYDPNVVLYDEPTSGLDDATAAEVTRVISKTHSKHPCALIIVTHDFKSSSPIADAIYLIDSEQKSLRKIEPEDWPRLSGILKESRPLSEDSFGGESTRGPAWRKLAGRQLARFFTATTHCLESIVLTPCRLVPVWKSPWWGFRFLLHYLRAVASPSAWLYIAITGAIIGFVATYFTFRFLPSANYTKPLVIEDLLRSMGFALYRILVPILVTILIAARCGAAVASDVGGKKYGRQMDALRTLGVEPRRYLLTGILYAFLIGTPWLVLIGYLSAAVTSLIVFTATHPGRGPWFWQLHFHRELVVPNHFLYTGTFWLLAKIILCAAGIATIAYARGSEPKDSTRSVSQGVTSTILWATLYVLVVHFIFAFVEFE
ncbi:MAG: ABC transporter permease [Pirellulales bacterium]|nr:ABC transporter permease [Pirellulales bacterium]